MTDNIQLTVFARDRANELFNHDAALKRLGGDNELFADMSLFFFEDSPGLLDEIGDGIEQQNAEKVVRAAHSLRGLAANFDAYDVVRIAQTIEQSAREENLGEIGKLLEELRGHVHRLNDALAQYRPV